MHPNSKSNPSCLNGKKAAQWRKKLHCGGKKLHRDRDRILKKSKIFGLCSGGRKKLHRDRDEETILCVIPVKTTRPRCYLTFIGSKLFLSTENYFTERNQYVVSCHQKSTNKEYCQVINFSSNPELTDVRQEAVALKIEQSSRRPGGDTC